MKTQINHELYESPEIEIIEMNSVQVMCTSAGDLGGTQQYGNGTWNN